MDTLADMARLLYARYGPVHQAVAEDEVDYALYCGEGVTIRCRRGAGCVPKDSCLRWDVEFEDGAALIPVYEFPKEAP